MPWSVHPGESIVEEYRDAWQRLNREHQHAHPLLDSNFVVPLYKHFGGSDVVLALKHESGNVAAGALLRSRGKGVWELFLPAQAQIGPIIVPIEQTRDSLRELLAALPGYAWMLGILNQDSAYPGVSLSSESRYSEKRQHARTINLNITGDFADYWKAREKGLAGNTDRRFRKLQREGVACSIQELRHAPDMAAAVRAHGELESTGWKGREGTAIHADNVQGRFYVEVLENFAQSDGARVYQLHFDEKLVASRLTVVQNQMLVFLKKTYDESCSSYAPGRLLDYLIFERLFAERDIKTVEYYTKATAEDSKWSTGMRDIYHLNYYRSTFWKYAASTMRKLRTSSGNS